MNQKLDRALLQNVLAGFGSSTKQAFVPMPGGQAEPVAGSSPATAALSAPMGAPQGAAPQGAPQGQDPSQGGGGMPPEIQEVLADPQVQQMLQQAGFTIDPASGSVIDPASGQPLPPDQLMQVLQQLMGGQQGGGAAPQGTGAPPAQDPNAQPQDPAGAQAASEPPPPDQMTQMVQLLTEIKDALVNGAQGKGGAAKEKQASVEEMLQGLTQQVQRQGEILQSMTGQQ
jgi:hypothetical protein